MARLFSRTSFKGLHSDIRQSVAVSEMCVCVCAHAGRAGGAVSVGVGVGVFACLCVVFVHVCFEVSFFVWKGTPQ